MVIPNWNGRSWLPACLASIREQTRPPRQVIVVDNGSADDSVAYLRAEHPEVEVLELGSNTGFAHAANVGLQASDAPFVALINTDVVLAADWLEHMEAALSDPGVASVACKMLSLEDEREVYDAGDVLRRDGVCEQRGRFQRDAGAWDTSEEIFGACAGAALYRREAVLETGGFDERYFAYLEDAELGLRLRLAGWRCRYEPVVALHAGGGSSHQLAGGHAPLAQRNTLLLIARHYPLRWLPLVAYRQAAWAWRALRERRLRSHLQASLSALPLLPAMLRERRDQPRPRVPIEQAVPALPVRGRGAGGHRGTIKASWRKEQRLRGCPRDSRFADAAATTCGAPSASDDMEHDSRPAP